MKKENVEVRVMNYFSENVNLLDYMDIAQDCAREIFQSNFNDIITDKFEMPTDDELKRMVAQRVPVAFDSDDFVANGPIDFGGIDTTELEEVLEKIEGIYEKFQEAQTVALAKAAGKTLKKLSSNVCSEIEKIRQKYSI